MVAKSFKISVALLAVAPLLYGGGFNQQAEKDREALKNYMLKKFANPAKDGATYFPYTTEDELKNKMMPVKNAEDFRLGSYSYSKIGRAQYDEINEMPPYEDAVDEGKELYEKKFKNGKSFKDCFPNPTIAGDYPKFDDKSKEVVTITSAINSCLKENGMKPWNTKKGDMTKLQAYFAYASREAKKKVDVKIQNKDAMEAYERGKKIYYSQRGYLKLSCATCHVQGAGKRVRNEYLSPLIGHTTHFPVYRLKWEGLGTLERRIVGCERNQGEKPHKPNSRWMKDLIYFMGYMSNGLPVDGPDVRK
jgi:sulfur-oxidizing protein SoxA